jgi:hypothetical protein
MSEVSSIQSGSGASSNAAATTAKASSGGATAFAAALSEAKKRPTGEKTAKVAGHHYEKITAGADKGRYLNKTGNARDGEDFAIVERDGRTYHVYDIDGKHEALMLPNGGSKSVTVKADQSG